MDGWHGPAQLLQLQSRVVDMLLAASALNNLHSSADAVAASFADCSLHVQLADCEARDSEQVP